MLRPATSADAAAVTALVTAAYTPYVARIGRAPAPMGVDYAALIAGGDDVTVLEADGVLVGVVVATVEADHVHVEMVAVAPSERGRGYGRALLDHAERLAVANGRVQVRLYTNAAMTENLAMYPRLGYVEVDRRRQDGFDRVFFVKHLDGTV